MSGLSSFLAPTAAGLSASLFLCSHSSGIYSSAVLTSPAVILLPLPQTFILGRQLNLLFLQKTKITGQKFSQLSPEYLENLFASLYSVCLGPGLDPYLPPPAPSQELPNPSVSASWHSGFCATFRAAPRITFLKYRSYSLPPLLRILECLCFVP